MPVCAHNLYLHKYPNNTVSTINNDNKKYLPHIRPSEKSLSESISNAVNHENQSALTTSAETGLTEAVFSIAGELPA